MEPSPGWRANLAFSARLTTITKITSAYHRCHSDVVAADARREAIVLETNAYNAAQSLEEYEQLCEERCKDLLRQAEPPVVKHEDVEKLPSPTGVNIGKFKNAFYHQEGLYSVIYKAIALDDAPYFPPEAKPGDRLVALKVTTPSVMTPPHDSKREARILELSKSEHVISLLEAFRDDGVRFVLVFPFMPFELDRLLQDQKTSRDQIKCCLKDMFSALSFIHSRGIIHRDVKPSNILLKSLDGPAYLSDFGIAWAPDTPGPESAESKITDVGTTCYRPPELLFGNKRYGCSLDLWAAGCTVAEAVVPGHPTLFDSGELGSDLALVHSIFTKLGTPSLTVWPEAANFPDWGKMQFHEYPTQSWSALLPGTSDIERDLVSKLVKYESGARMTAAQGLNHPYFKQ
ncbi:kinase-like protein [Lojkania enalia]|uniref:cyclin-dependent kinase n=1 Tax=Lojkania enalia TaxID=147567 RepID=A0A9P4JZB7_9PLEO|nr:kinase-like protein [Didymosphaeria enalia]